MKDRFRLIEDPGHAWLEVPMSLLNELGIADQITTCSYRHGDTAYLEEDVDMHVFVSAMEKTGRPIGMVEVFQDPTAIRNYLPYSAC